MPELTRGNAGGAIPGWVAGLFYGNDTEGAAGTYSTGTLTANTLYAVWCATPLGGSAIDRIGVEFTTGSAGKHARAGIYLPDGARGRPNSLLLDSGALAADSIAVVTAVVAAQLPGGGVWLALLPEDATMAFRKLGAAGIIAVVGKPALGGTTAYSAVAVALAYGALPATFPAGAAPNTGAVIINVRAA